MGIGTYEVKPGHMPSSIQRRIEYIEQRLAAVEDASPALVLHRTIDSKVPYVFQEREDMLQLYEQRQVRLEDDLSVASEGNRDMQARLQHAEKFIGEQAGVIADLKQNLQAMTLAHGDLCTEKAELREKLEAKSHYESAYWEAWRACTDALGGLWKPKDKESGQACAVRVIHELKRKAMKHE